MKLKHSKKEDEEYLWQTYEIAMKSHIENIWGWDLVWQKNDFEKNLAQYTSAIITITDQTIGSVQYKIEGNKAYINMLILEPSQQSKGFGRVVLNQLSEMYDSEILTLRCFKVNKRAHHFYLREGFKLIDEDEHFYLLSKVLK